MNDEDLNPWQTPPQFTCRLCGWAGTKEKRGLCQSCEDEFARPPESPDDHGGEEYKPTPPLKGGDILNRRSELCRRRGSESEAMIQGRYKGKEIGLVGLAFPFEGNGGSKGKYRNEDTGSIWEFEDPDGDDTTPLIKKKQGGSLEDWEHEATLYTYWDDVLQDYNPSARNNYNSREDYKHRNLADSYER